MIRTAIIFLAVSLPALGGELRPAPDYWVRAQFNYAIAEKIAGACVGISLDHKAVSRFQHTADTKLSDDGFHMRWLATEMAPISAERWSAGQSSFLAEHASGTAELDLCVVARSEIASGSVIGTLLQVKS